MHEVQPLRITKSALGVDSRLLPAVQMQFKHITAAMTESSYWGIRREQIEPVNSVQQQQTALTIFEAATGRSLLAGRMGEQVENNLAELRKRIEGLGTSTAWMETVHYTESLDLRMWFSPHGKCLPLASKEMRCHLFAGSRPNRSLQPNYKSREPSICIGCSNFLLDYQHKNFWLKRFQENAVAYARAEAKGEQDGWRVVGERAAQARILVKKLGVSDDEIDGIFRAAYSAAE